MLRHLVTIINAWLFKPSQYEVARASYGTEPRYRPQEVTLAERIDCIIQNDVKYILRDVVGLKEINETDVNEHPRIFRELLPVSTNDFIEFVRANGFPRRVAIYAKPSGLDRYIYRNDSGQWVVTEFDDRNTRWDFPHESKWKAEQSVIHQIITSNSHLFVDGAIYKP